MEEVDAVIPAKRCGALGCGDKIKPPFRMYRWKVPFCFRAATVADEQGFRYFCGGCVEDGRPVDWTC